MSDLSQKGLTALTWVFTGAGIVLTAGRYAIRLKTIKSLKADDYVHGAALIVLIGYVSTYTVMFPLNYSVEFWAAGLGDRPSAADLKRYFHLEIAVSLLFWIDIYLVKCSFLLFFRMLFGVSRLFMRVWWAVCAFTLVTFLVNFFSVLWACEAPRHLFLLDRCLSEKARHRNSEITSMWCGLNVASDLSIILLPLWMLRGLQMSTSRKVGLAAIFSIAVIDVIFDITRTVYTVDRGAVALDTIWDILEPTVAVIVSTLPTYKALLRAPKKEKRAASYQTLGHDAVDPWSSASTHHSAPSSNVRLTTISSPFAKGASMDHASERSTDATDTVAFV